MIYHHLYISEKTPLYKEETDLERILESSRKNNVQKNITGLLIKNGVFFIQVLEGKREDVLTTFNRISPDPRHMKVKTLLTYNDSVRIFPEWSMGIVDNDKHKVSIDKLIPLLHVDVIKLKSSKEKIIMLLKNFTKAPL